MKRGPNFRHLDPEDQILTNVSVDDNGCWVWMRAVETSGYGVICVEGKSVMRRAHRYSYEVFVGPVPEGLFLDHLCRNIKCVNPDHLEPVTAKENTRRSLAARGLDTHCAKGHERNEQNLRIRYDGVRRCLTCERERARDRRERKKGA